MDRIVGSVQKRYGYSREEAEKQVDMFLKEVRGRLEARRASSQERRSSGDEF